MGQGIAILSFDCEGKWGVADQLTPWHGKTLTKARLRWAYSRIFDLLCDHDVTATFAFVELFTREVDRSLKRLISDLSKELPYLVKAAHLIQNDDDGWFCPWVLEMFDERHEIAFHGYTHVPWPDLSPDQARSELKLVPVDRRRTMVFPRNEIAHLNVLAEFGVEGYRGAPKAKARAHAFATEFNLWENSETPQSYQNLDLLEIPAGFFVNWDNGLRRIIPTPVTRMRARNILRHAGDNDGVAHFWLHPENLATNPGTLHNLQAIIEEICSARDAGHVTVFSQIEYCRRVAATRRCSRTGTPSSAAPFV